MQQPQSAPPISDAPAPGRVPEPKRPRTTRWPKDTGSIISTCIESYPNSHLFPHANRGQSAGVEDDSIPSHQQLTAAAACLQSGRWAQAEAICRQLLLREPSNADALHMLGYLAHRAGQRSQAIELLSRAISGKPDQASFHSTLGVVLSTDGRIEQAIEAYRRALALEPQAAQT